MSDKGERRRSRFGTQQSLALGFPSFPLVYLSVCVRVFGIFTLRTCAKGPAPDSSVPASVPNPMSLLSNDPAAGNPAPDTASLSLSLYSFTMPPERERLARNDTSRRRIKNRQTKKKKNKQEISNRQRRKRIAAGSYCGSVPKEKEEERDRERREGHQ